MEAFSQLSSALPCKYARGTEFAIFVLLSLTSGRVGRVAYKHSRQQGRLPTLLFAATLHYTELLQIHCEAFALDYPETTGAV